MKQNRSSALPTDSGKPIRTYGEARVCSECGTVLSRYNESGRCSVHRGWGDGRDAARGATR